MHPRVEGFQTWMSGNKPEFRGITVRGAAADDESAQSEEAYSATTLPDAGRATSSSSAHGRSRP
jgi:hypothetical protein